MSACRCGADASPGEDFCDEHAPIYVEPHKPVTAEELAEIARLDRLATQGPFRVNRYDCEGGAINWQVQQDEGADDCEVIANITDDEPKRARYDAAFYVLARTLLPRVARDLAERTADLQALADMLDEAGIGHRDGDTVRTRLARMIADANTEAERTEKAEATVERLIREAGAVRNDERQRAKAEHEALDDGGRQRDANRIERLEGELARLRVIVDDADRAKAEHEATRDELRRLHDVLSGKRPLTK